LLAGGVGGDARFELLCLETAPGVTPLVSSAVPFAHHQHLQRIPGGCEGSSKTVDKASIASSTATVSAMPSARHDGSSFAKPTGFAGCKRWE